VCLNIFNQLASDDTQWHTENRVQIPNSAAKTAGQRELTEYIQIWM